MKIGITGAQGVGKTTLAHKLAQELKVPLINEVARQFPIPTIRSIEEYADVQKGILIKQLNEESMHRSYVTDRTVIDNLAYWIALCSETAPIEDTHWYVNEVKHHLSVYDRIIYVPPPNRPIEDDGFRFVTKSMQQHVDAIIRTLLYTLNVVFEKHQET